jgi:plasmid stability protein
VTMAQLLVRKLDEADIGRLRARARANGTSVEALARDAIRKEAQLTVEEKLALVREMQAKFRAALVPGARQTLGGDLIREDRDHDH